MSQGFDLTSLANLLRPNQHDQDDDDSDDYDERVSPQVKNVGPGNIGVKRNKEKGNGDHVRNSSTLSTSSADIWTPNEVAKASEQLNTSCASDPRKTPMYKMYYRQSVTPEDVFLQMGNKTPSSASCENLVVEINLPDEEDFNKIQLNLKEQAIDLRSPQYYLYLGLPHPIDTKGGHAKWDQNAEKLIVTLILTRDLDRLNF